LTASLKNDTITTTIERIYIMTINNFKDYPTPGGEFLIDIYPEIQKSLDPILNNSFKKEMTIDQFNKDIGNFKLIKMADCVYNIQTNFPESNRGFIDGPEWDGKLVDYIPIDSKISLWKKINLEWVYAIVYDCFIVKIGMTSAGLSKRFGSYLTGSKKAMKKGSCATTNFAVSECHYLALSKKHKVEIFGYQIPELYTQTEKIAGKSVKARAQVAPTYEQVLIDLYKKKTGNIPIFCGQKGNK